MKAKRKEPLLKLIGPEFKDSGRLPQSSYKILREPVDRLSSGSREEHLCQKGLERREGTPPPEEVSEVMPSPFKEVFPKIDGRGRKVGRGVSHLQSTACSHSTGCHSTRICGSSFSATEL
jgi:hypothetical protein